MGNGVNKFYSVFCALCKWMEKFVNSALLLSLRIQGGIGKTVLNGQRSPEGEPEAVCVYCEGDVCS